MGYYVEVPENKGKAEQIASIHGGMVLPEPPNSYESVPSDQAIICVVNNGAFEAAAFCYSEKEFNYFKVPDSRPRTWILMDREKACKLTGFKD